MEAGSADTQATYSKDVNGKEVTNRKNRYEVIQIFIQVAATHRAVDKLTYLQDEASMLLLFS